ncbi:hypothetical protein GCM10022419_079190 [Nonomuraea rosea]|uniref:Carrier domain-containing protein n=1 Tax=Nonomuraea rosea TaxID=638574 RepID=A0ABP6YN21_9ACTN
MNLLDLLLGLVAERMGVAEVDPDRLFIDYGIGSYDAVALAGVLAEHTGTTLPNSAFYEHPTARALAAYLEGVVGGPALASTSGDTGTHLGTSGSYPGAHPGTSGDTGTRHGAFDGVGGTRSGFGRMGGMGGDGGLVAEPVAIVGIGCRLPGADGPGELWELLTSGADLVGPVPAARAERDEGWSEPGVGVGGFLPEVEAFDPAFFAINAREAAAMDPQQRMVLEVAHEALQDAGLRVADVTRTSTGVFVGISSNDYLVGRFSGGPAPDAYTPTGTAHSVAANRISYVFDLHGPSMAIDTACSSSLVAIHQAALALRTGQCDVALAGGVNAVLSPDIGRCFRTAGVLAPDGRCKSFGAGADGMGRSEGTVMVALKRLPDALAAGDRVYALIRGGAVNSDGRTNGLMSPSAPAQVRLLRAACRSAGVAPGQVEYVEAHGSGTRLGDLMELRALSEVLGTAQRLEPLRVGSLKSNLGHLEAAAGAAGVAKVALAMFHGVLPGGLHADHPAEDFGWDAGGLRVLTRAERWGGRLAGVSSFGFGGTNAHLILQTPPSHPAAPSPGEAAPSSAAAVVSTAEVAWASGGVSGAASASGATAEAASGGVASPSPARWAVRSRRYLPLSAHTPQALRELAERWRDLLVEPGLDLAAACHTAGARRDHHAYRLAVSGTDAADLAAELERALTDLVATPPSGPVTGGLALVFTGEPTLLGTSAEGLPGAELAEVLRRAGIVPEMVIGDEVGELSAAYYSGALSAADAQDVAAGRARLLAGLPIPHALRVRLAARLAEALCRRTGPGLAVAAVESPQTCVIAGPPVALARVRAALADGGVPCAELGPATAAHSEPAAQAAPELEAALAGLTPQDGLVTLVSTLTGGPVDGKALDAAHWAGQLARPSLLGDALSYALDHGVRTFVEIGPGSLGPHLRALEKSTEKSAEKGTEKGTDKAAGKADTVAKGGRKARIVRCAGPDDVPSALIRLYELGHAPHWAVLNPVAGVTSIPLLPWSREWSSVEVTA